MRILYGYLRNYWKLAATALVLAAINQIFSLLDPWIFRYIIDNYATKYSQYSSAQFLRGVSGLLAAAVFVAFVSRVAKNFQDYFVNLITQQVGARLYADGIRHSLELPYTLFEDQRSGETLGKLQKVRTDVEKLINMAVNLVFRSERRWHTPLAGTALHALRRPALRRDSGQIAEGANRRGEADQHGGQPGLHHADRPGIRDRLRLPSALVGGAGLPADRAAARRVEQGAEPQDQGSAEAHRARDHRAGWRHHRIAAQYRAGEEPGPGAAGDRASQLHHRQDSQAGIEEGALPAQPELHTGHLRQPAAHLDSVPHALPDLHPAHHGGAVLFAVHLFVFHFRAAAGIGQRDQRLSRDGGVAAELRDHPEPAA